MRSEVFLRTWDDATLSILTVGRCHFQSQVKFSPYEV